MGEVRRVKGAVIFPLVSEILEHGQSARVNVTGYSMVPFLREGLDSVELIKGSFESLNRGDIVLIQRRDGAYVLHRVIKKKPDCFYMVGDAQDWVEGPLYPDQLLAVVSAIWRKDKRIPCDNIWLNFLARIWLILRRQRPFIFRLYRFLKRMLGIKKPQS